MDSLNFSILENKMVVTRFNRDVIELGSEAAFFELVAADFVNHTASPGSAGGAAGLLHMLNNVLRPALGELKVQIHSQVAEEDVVATRKSIHGTHCGNFMGAPATGKSMVIDVIEFVRIKNGQYVEHWASNSVRDR